MREGKGGGGDGKSRQPEVKPVIRWAFFLFSLVPLPVRRFSHPLHWGCLVSPKGRLFFSLNILFTLPRLPMITRGQLCAPSV